MRKHPKTAKITDSLNDNESEFQITRRVNVVDGCQDGQHGGLVVSTGSLVDLNCP